MSSTTRPQIGGIHHLKLPVTDVARSVEWYTEVMGGKRRPELDHVADGKLYAVILDVPGLPCHLEIRHDPQGAGGCQGFDPIVYRVLDRPALEDWAAFLDTHEVEHSPVLRGLIGWLMVFFDPDGISVRLYTDESHAFDLAGADVNSPWLARHRS